MPPRRTGNRGQSEKGPSLEAAIRTTSDDPDLDMLLVRFHPETGARRQGALGLRHADIDQRRSTAWLREKNGHEREQPLSPTLTRLLIHHAPDRGSRHPDNAVFRRRNGTPVTARRYLQATLADVATPIATLTGQPHPLARRRTHAASGQTASPILCVLVRRPVAGEEQRLGEVSWS